MTPTNLSKEISILERALKREQAMRYMLASVIIVLLIAFLSKGSETKTIVVPFHGAETDTFVTDNTISQEYLRKLTKRVSQLGFTFSPATADSNFDELLTLVAPDAYGLVNKAIVKKREYIKKMNLSSVFYPSQFTYDLKGFRVAAKGLLKTFSGSKLVSEESVTLRFDFALLGDSHTATLVAFKDVSKQRDPFSERPSYDGQNK